MKLQMPSGRNGTVVVQLESGDPRVRNESDLWYKLRNILRSRGFDVIKKEMSKDGNMVSDHVFYVRTRKLGKGAWAIYDSRYAVRDSAEDLRRDGEVRLNLISYPDFG